MNSVENIVTANRKLKNALRTIRTLNSPVYKFVAKSSSTRSRERVEENSFTCPLEAQNFINSFAFDNLPKEKLLVANNSSLQLNFRFISPATSDVRMRRYHAEAVRTKTAFRAYVQNENRYADKMHVLPPVSPPNKASVEELMLDTNEMNVLHTVDFLRFVNGCPVPAINCFPSQSHNPLLANCSVEDVLRDELSFSLYTASPWEHSVLERSMLQTERLQHSFSVDETADAVRARVDSKSTNVSVPPAFQVTEFLTTVLCFNHGGEVRRNFRLSETKCTPLLLRCKSQEPLPTTVASDFEDVMEHNRKKLGLEAVTVEKDRRLAVVTQAVQFWLYTSSGVAVSALVVPLRVKNLLDGLTTNQLWRTADQCVPKDNSDDEDVQNFNLQTTAFGCLQHKEDQLSAKNLLQNPRSSSAWVLQPVCIGSIKQGDVRQSSSLQPFEANGALSHDDATKW